MNTTSSLDSSSFTFGADGFFYDPFGEPCVLVGVVEFSKLCQHLDSMFESPLGRKLIYAATDAEERVLSNHPTVQFGRWFGRSKAQRRLKERASQMGWGGFDAEHVTSPAHDALTVGFSLAHHEHLSQCRANVEWSQASAEVIHLTYSPKNETMTPAPVPQHLTWFGLQHGGSSEERLEIELDRRVNAFFHGEERSFFLPVNVFKHLLTSLLGRPLSPEFSPAFHLEIDQSLEHGEAFRTMIHASCLAFEASDRPVYVQSSSDWKGHLTDRLTKRGFGRTVVEKSILDGDGSSVFSVQSSVAPVTIGLLIGMWQRAHGTIGDAKIEVAANSILVHLSLRGVDYL